LPNGTIGLEIVCAEKAEKPAGRRRKTFPAATPPTATAPPLRPPPKGLHHRECGLRKPAQAEYRRPLPDGKKLRGSLHLPSPSSQCWSSRPQEKCSDRCSFRTPELYEAWRRAVVDFLMGPSHEQEVDAFLLCGNYHGGQHGVIVCHGLTMSTMPVPCLLRWLQCWLHGALHTWFYVRGAVKLPSWSAASNISWIAWSRRSCLLIPVRFAKLSSLSAELTRTLIVIPDRASAVCLRANLLTEPDSTFGGSFRGSGMD
jgi:hypothetical protein